MTALAAFVGALALWMGAYLALVRTVDPYGDFNAFPRHFPLLIWDSRPAKLALFQSYRAAGPVQGLILGSSRSAKLSPSEFEARTGKRFFNFGVGSAPAEEYLATYRWIRRQGVRPEIVIIGLDIEALNNSDAPVPGFRRSAALNAMLVDETAPFERIRDVLRIYNQAFTIPYFQDTCRAVALSRRPHPAQGDEILDPDGLERDREIEREVAQGTFDLAQHIQRCLPNYVARFSDRTGLSRRRERDVEQAVREARRDGAAVVVWLTPLHPVTVEHLAQRTRYRPLLEDARRYLAHLETSLEVSAYDFSDPSTFGGSLTGWYDCAHMDAGNASKVVAGLVQGL